MRKRHFILSTIFCLLASFVIIQPVQADEMTGLGVGAKVGTLGVGVDVIGRINDSLNLRLGLQGFTYDISDTYNDIDYEADLDLFSGMLLADLFPFGNNFRISAGVMLNQNEVTMTGKPTNRTYNIGGINYPAVLVGSLTGTVDFNTVAPYAGIGYGGAFSDNSNWSFFCDLGVLFQGSPNLTYTADGALSGNPIFEANLEKERQELEDDMSKYEYYPVLSLGVTYKF
jgi:hypothetical protein